MPIFLWGDKDFQRYKESYFDEFPGVWRQGDFFRINERLGGFVLGRSDATLNRHGVRIGTAEIYRSLALLPEVEDSLIVNLDIAGGKFFMPLFVKLRGGQQLDAPSDRARFAPSCARSTPRAMCRTPSTRSPDIPYTLTGKRMEVPVRRILAGTPPAKACQSRRHRESGGTGLFCGIRAHADGLSAGRCGGQVGLTRRIGVHKLSTPNGGAPWKT